MLLMGFTFELVGGTVLFNIERPPPLGEGEFIEAGSLWPANSIF